MNDSELEPNNEQDCTDLPPTKSHEHVTRQRIHGREAVGVFDAKYHPMDDFTRPAAAKRHRQKFNITHESSENEIDEEDDESLDLDSDSSSDAKPPPPKRRLVVSRGTRKSTRISKLEPYDYNGLRHPQDKQLRKVLGRDLGSLRSQPSKRKRVIKRRSPTPEKQESDHGDGDDNDENDAVEGSQSQHKSPIHVSSDSASETDDDDDDAAAAINQSIDRALNKTLDDITDEFMADEVMVDVIGHDSAGFVDATLGMHDGSLQESNGQVSHVASHSDVHGEALAKPEGRTERDARSKEPSDTSSSQPSVGQTKRIPRRKLVKNGFAIYEDSTQQHNANQMHAANGGSSNAIRTEKENSISAQPTPIGVSPVRAAHARLQAAVSPAASRSTPSTQALYPTPSSLSASVRRASQSLRGANAASEGARIVLEKLTSTAMNSLRSLGSTRNDERNSSVSQVIQTNLTRQNLTAAATIHPRPLVFTNAHANQNHDHQDESESSQAEGSSPSGPPPDVDDDGAPTLAQVPANNAIDADDGNTSSASVQQNLDFADKGVVNSLTLFSEADKSSTTFFDDATAADERFEQGLLHAEKL